MNGKRFERWNDNSCKVKDNQENTFLNWEDVVDKLNALAEENEQLKSSVNVDAYGQTIEQLKQENKRLKRQLGTQDTIKIQYHDIVSCLEIIIDTLERENRQLNYQIIKLQDKLEKSEKVID